jgi:hypothetical protein
MIIKIMFYEQFFMTNSRIESLLNLINLLSKSKTIWEFFTTFSLAVELGFGQKFKPDPRVDVRSGWTDQSFQFDPRIDVWRVLSSLFDVNRMR